jgi:uncharacterized protein (TIGR03437 family)
VAIGDFNGDGKGDLAVANSTSSNVSVLLGNGTGGFSAASNFSVGTSPGSVAVADFNGDGKPDLAVANANSNTVSVLLGDGLGGFAAASSFGVGTFPTFVALGDFNGDGKPDLAVANKLSNTVSVLLGDGTGGFGAPSSFGVGSFPQSVAVGDFNGDGKPDLAVANFNSGNVSVLLGDGAGGFAAASNFGVGSGPASVAGGDFNGDRKPDLAVVNYGNGSVSVLLGNGTGGFVAAGIPIAVGSDPYSVAVGDFDRDGKPDLAVANANNNNVSVLLGNGTGGFSAASNFAVGSQPLSVAVGDLNGDGRPDIVTANSGSNKVSILLNRSILANPASLTLWAGGGQGSPAGIPVTVDSTVAPATYMVSADPSWLMTVPPTGITPSAVTVSANSNSLAAGVYTGTARYTATGFFDAATNVTLHVSNPSGTFAAVAGGPIPVGTGPVDVAVGDFNGDGKLDLAVANLFDNTLSVRLGDGTGGFTAAGSPIAVGAGPSSVALGDFNGDDKLDLAVANVGSSTVSVLLGDGTGGFSVAGIPIAMGSGPASVTVADFNGDGKPDLATANYFSNNVSVLLGDGMGGFSTAGSPVAVGTEAISAATGDLNGDGKLDLVVINRGNNNVSVLLGAGMGQFSVAGSPIPVGIAPRSVTVADFNGDGKPDLAVANTGSGTVSVLPGDGTGGFSSAGSPIAVGFFPWSLRVGDFNGDGRPDLAVANQGANSVSVLLGTGTGGFSAASGGPLATGSGPTSVAVGDFNGDGKSDLVVGNQTGNTVSVFLGKLAPTTATLIATSPTAMSYGQTVSFNLTVANTGTHFNSATGTTDFLDGAALIGTASQTSGPYTFTAPGLSVGSHSITAAYSGDIRTASSTSNAIVIQVNPASQTIAFGPLSDAAYGIAPFSLNASVSSGLPVSFSSNSTSVCTVSGATVTILDIGTCSITASQSGNTNYTAAAPVPRTFNVTNGPAASLSVVSGANQTATVNTAFSTPFQVKAVDAGNHAVPGFLVTFTSPASGASCGYPSNSAAVTTDTSGIASVLCTANTTPGTYSVTVSGLGVAPVNIASLANQAGSAATLTVLAGSPQSTAVNTVFPTAFQVKLTDAFGNPAAGQTVTFTAPASGSSGTFAGSPAVTASTNASGVATAPAFTANSQAGSYQVTASALSLSTGLMAANTSGPASVMTIVAGDNQGAAAGTAFAAALVVKVTDQFQNPLSGVAVTFTTPVSGASGTFSGSATVNTNASGVATAPVFTANGTSGAYTVTASAGALSRSFNLTNLTGAPANLTIVSGNSQSAIVSAAYATPLAVRLSDASNNPIAGQTVTFTAPATGASGAFAASATVSTNASGVATAPALTANSTVGPFMVTAGSGGLNANFNLTNLSLPPTGIAGYSGSSQLAAPGSPFPSPLVARVFDSKGNAVANASVTFTLPASGASAVFGGASPLSFTTTTNAQGLATSAMLTSNQIAGSYSVMATSGAFFTSFTLTNLNLEPDVYSVSPEVLIFRYEVGGALPPAQTAQVTSPRNAFTFTVDAPWIKAVSKPNGSINDTLSVAVDPAGLTPGNYSGNIVIGNGAVLRVSLQVVAPPQIVPSARSMTFDYQVGGPAPGEQMLYVTAYTRNFSFSATPVQGGSGKVVWLQVSGAANATTPAALHVSIAPDGLEPGTYEGVIHLVAADASNSPVDVRVMLTVRAGVASPPEITGVVNAASSQSGAVAPNEIVSLYGKNLACAEGPQVLINDAPPTILASTGTQINFVLPAILAAPQAALRFRCGSASAGPQTLAVARYAPGIFMGQGTQVAAFNEGFVINGSGAPAARGSVLMLFGTGFGLLGATDESGLQWLAAHPAVTVGGLAAEVLFAGAAPGLPGVTQINVRIPRAAPAGTVGVTVTLGTMSVQPGLTVALQ